MSDLIEVPQCPECGDVTQTCRCWKQPPTEPQREGSAKQVWINYHESQNWWDERAYDSKEKAAFCQRKPYGECKQVRFIEADPLEAKLTEAREALEHANERVAKTIYEQWSHRPGYVHWQAGGNSWMQDEARAMARQTLTQLNDHE